MDKSFKSESIESSSDEKQTMKIHEKSHKIANKIRTNLLVYVHNDNMKYLKTSNFMLNSQLPKELIQKYEQFEKKFDNPFIMSSSKINHKSLENPFRKQNKTIIDSEIADYLENKKISCAHKKLKIKPEIYRKSQRISDNYMSKYGKTYYSSGSYNSLFEKFMNEEEKKKLNILKGYEKLKTISNNLNQFKFINKNIKKTKTLPQKEDYTSNMNKKQYEELFELLEYKGIEFKNCQKTLDHKLFMNYSDQREKRYSNSQDKLKKNEKIDKSINYSSKEIQIVKKLDKKSFSTKKTMPLPPKDKGSDKKTKYCKNKSPSTKVSSEFNSKVSSSNLINLYPTDRYTEKHPSFKEKFSQIDYDNYRENLNTSAINIKEEGDSVVHSDFTDSNHHMFTLKPIESSNGKDAIVYRSPQSIYTSYDPKEFNSNTFMRENKNSQTIADNYEEYDNYINKLNCPFKKTNLENKENFFNVPTVDSNNNNDNSFYSNSDNSCSKAFFVKKVNSNNTRSFSIVSRSSGEIDL